MECAKPSLRQGFVFFINGLERYWNYSVTVYRKFSKITPGSAKCGGWGDMRTPTPPRHYATQCGAAAGPASRRERRALGLHALAREAECWGVRGKHSPALLSFRNLQNFAHTIYSVVGVHCRSGAQGMAHYHHRPPRRGHRIHFFANEYRGNDDRTLYEGRLVDILSSSPAELKSVF